MIAKNSLFDPSVKFSKLVEHMYKWKYFMAGGEVKLHYKLDVVTN